MTVQTNVKVPQIRFKGFTGAWVDKKLGDIGQTQSGIGFPDAEQGGKTGVPFFKVSDMTRVGNDREMLTSNNYVSNSQLMRKKWTPISNVPAVIFAKVGAAIMLNRKRMVRSPFLIDNNLMSYLFDSTWDINFGQTLFDTINLPFYSQVGALPSYNGSDIESIVIHRPDEVEEQQKIGEYFRKLDCLIGLHQRKHEKLVTLKKSMLQKMIPQGGATAPEMRFKGFNEPWVKIKLGDILLSHSYRPYLSDLISTGGFDVIQQGDRPIAGYASGTPFEEFEDVILFGDHTLSLFRPERPFLVSSDGVKILGNRLGLFRDYFYSLLLACMPASEGYKRHLAILKEIEISVSLNKKEQEKFGTYFRMLDNLISKQASQLQKLKQIKTACLEMMFV